MPPTRYRRKCPAIDEPLSLPPLFSLLLRFTGSLSLFL
jgi:hypothetical protein